MTSAQGDGILRDGEQHKTPAGSGSDAQAKRRKKSTKDDYSRALRSVYDETLREDVPDDFLSLLGKLD